LPFKKLERVQGEWELLESSLYSLFARDTVGTNLRVTPVNVFLVKVAISAGNLLALLDSGATHNFVSTDSLPLLVHKHVGVVKTSISLGNGSRVLVTVDEYDIQIHVPELTNSVPTYHRFYCWSDLKYNLVLGMPWLQLCNPVINWSQLQFAAPSINLLSVAASLPSEYSSYKSVFEEPDESNLVLPPHRPFDLSIDFRDDSTLPKLKPIYSFTIKEQEALKSYIEDGLKSGIIRPSTSIIASPIFFVPK